MPLFEPFSELRSGLDSCRDFQRLEERGFVDELLAHHHLLMRYFYDFLDLAFEAEPGSESLLAAVALARRLNRQKKKTLPPNAPTGFIPRAWRKALPKLGPINRQLWEVALAFVVRDGLRSGDLYLTESRQHVSFWNLIYDQERWSKERDDAYVELGLTSEAQKALDRLREEFNEAADRLLNGFADNRFASIQHAKLKLKRRDALDVPEGVRDLRRLIEMHLPRVRIEELLLKVDSWCRFSREFLPLGDQAPPSGRVGPALFAALVAHGTNLGVATMAQSTEGITMDMLLHVSKWFLRTETLNAANRVLVNYHHRLDLSSVWGDGFASSSDGQRFRIDASSLLASFYPRYFGFYERAITLYTHVSDQYFVFATRAISCSPREAIYVLDGLLENDTVLRPREHFTDTHGFTEQLFALCYLLGYSFIATPQGSQGPTALQA